MQLTDEQFNLIKEQFKTLKDRSPFYAKKFEGIDLSDVQTQADFEKLPFSEKADLREAYPLGIQAVPDEEVVRIHSSSGTTARRSLFLTPRRMLPIGPKCSRVAIARRVLPIRIAFKLPLAMVCGLRALGSSLAASAWALWLFPWVLAIPRSSCK